MLKIVGLDILDFIAFPSGILFVLKENQDADKVKVSFYSYDIVSGSIAGVTKNAYLLTKFGPAYEPVAKQLGDYVSCDALRLWNGNTFVIYSSGETGIFDEKGKLVSTGEIKYRGSPARDAAADNNFIWSVVPEKNLIVKYSLLQNRVVMRVGGENSDTFSRPVSAAEYDGCLYICNSKSRKIKRMKLNNFSVDDYKEFDEAVYKYIKIGNCEFVALSSGIYLI